MTGGPPETRGLWPTLIVVAALVCAVIAGQVAWALDAEALEVLTAAATVFAGTIGLGMTIHHFMRTPPQP